jgi:outer membrane protein TolC
MKNSIIIFLILLLSLSLKAQDTVQLNVLQCHEMALRNSRELQHSENAVQQAKLTRKAVLTNFFPQIEGSATGIYTKDYNLIHAPSGDIDLLIRGAYMCGFQLTQPIYVGGKIRNGYRLTKIGIEAAEEQQRMQRAQIIVDVENAYWTYVATLEKVSLLEEYKNMLETLREQVENSVDVGMATDYDLMQLKAAYSNILYQMKRTQSGVALCRMALSRMIGIDYDSVYIAPDNTINIAEMPSNISSDISERPEVKLMNLQLKANKLQVKMTVADYLPTLGLGLGYIWFGNIKLKGDFLFDQIGLLPINPPVSYHLDKEFKYDAPVVMLSLKVPITKWWEGSYNIKKAKLEVENSRLDKERNEELLQLEVRQAIFKLEEGYQLIEASKLALDAATEQLRMANNRYEVSLTPLSDFLDAQLKWQQAKSDYIEAQTQYLIYQIDYKRVTGALQE